MKKIIFLTAMLSLATLVSGCSDDDGYGLETHNDFDGEYAAVLYNEVGECVEDGEIFELTIFKGDVTDTFYGLTEVNGSVFSDSVSLTFVSLDGIVTSGTGFKSNEGFEGKWSTPALNCVGFFQLVKI